MRVLVLIFWFALPVLSKAQKTRVWIDTDIMIGKFAHDVDDGLALLLVLNDTNIQVEGISFVHGVKYAEKVTQKMLSGYASDLEIPTYRGADDSTEYLQKTDAVLALSEAMKEGPITILALGPMTNIATVVKLYPELTKNIENITYCGGRKPNQILNPGNGKNNFSDYNFDLDPHAAEVVLNSDVPLLLAGYDCGDNFYMTKTDFVHLKKSSRKIDRWLYRKLKNWHGLWRTFLGSKNGFIPFDCMTVGALFYPDQFEISEAIPSYIKVRENDSPHTVKTKTKQYLEVSKNEDGRIVSYCSGTRNEFRSTLLKALNHPDYQ